MWFFWRKKSAPSFDYPVLYKAAGCIFVSERLVLAGYQPHKKQPVLSGIGGRREMNETAPMTAFRETIEELYNVKEIPQGLIPILQRKMIPHAVLSSGSYAMLVFTIEQLITLLKICKRWKLKSPLYRTLPTSLDSLLLDRLPDATAEISHLCLLPIVDIPNHSAFLDPAFASDIRRIFHHPDLRVTS